MAARHERLALITEYFEQNLGDREITFVLKEDHGIDLSTRQLKRILRRHGLTRRHYTNPLQVVDFIFSELSKSGQLLGYRMMYHKCRQAGLRVPMESVRTVLRLLDPARVQLRQARRLVRRAYFAKGPNFVWHVDGYDKLKPYGLCIHGCICGFSRKIIWLNVHNSNNNPRIVAGYFVESIREHGGVPRLVRGDLGTENVIIRGLQQFLRRDGADDHAATPYIGGASVTNQRIESWWGVLRRECVQFWMDTFKELLENGEFHGDFMDKNLVQFCFTAVVQDELDSMAKVWNSHTIRPSRNPRAPSGRPNHMYSFPSFWGAEDQLCRVFAEDIEACLPECEFRSPIPCDPDLHELCTRIMYEQNIHEFPHNASDAVALYRFLRNEIANMI